MGRPLCGVSEAALFVAHRKTRDDLFVPPLDGRPGHNRRAASSPIAIIDRRGSVSEGASNGRTG
jgi:hypothetical protein